MKRILLTACAALLAVAAVAPFAPVTHAQNWESSSLFITDDNRMSVLLPNGWFAAGDVQGIQVANREALLTETNTELQPGDEAFLVLPIARADLAAFDIEADASLEDIANFLFPFLLSNETNDITVQRGGEVEYAGGTMIRAIAYDANNGYALHLYDNLAPGYIGVRIFTGPKNEFGEGEENGMLGIAMTVQFSLELTQTYTSSDGTVSFSFPTDYVAIEDEPTGAYIYDSAATQAAAEAQEETAPGQVRLLTIAGDPASLGEITDDVLKAVVADIANQISRDSDNNPEVGVPFTFDNETLGPAAGIYASSDIGSGGVVAVYNEAANVVAVVIYAGGPDEGSQLMLTALNIAHSMIRVQS